MMGYLYKRFADFGAVCFLALSLWAGLASLPAYSVEPDEILPDAQQEALAREISKQLRCVVCQNQSIDDSDASIAKDMRVKVRDLVVEGQDAEAIKGYFVERYGNYVLLNPPFDASTALLWLMPIILLLIAAGGIIYALLRRRTSNKINAVAPLSAEEQARLDALLDEGGKS